jgi:uncharacterized protein YycO
VIFLKRSLKKNLYFIFALILFLSLSSIASGSSSSVPPPDPSSAYYPGTTTSIISGDILVTKDYTLTPQWPGHAAIVVDYQNIVQIVGPNTPLVKISIQAWFASFPNTKVVRINSASVALASANWASTYYNNYHLTVGYDVFSDLFAYQNYTYCSKVVWDAYFFGGGVILPYTNTPGWANIQPFDFIYNPANPSTGLSTVVTIGTAW